jgi:hypothetical protein
LAATLVIPDTYDLVGYRALVGGAPAHVQTAIRSILRGFGPVAPEPEAGIPTYDLRPAGERWHVRRDGTAIQVEATLSGALGVLEWHLVSAALEHRSDLFHLHGAALAVPGQPASVLLTGPSGSGKTTLTMALMQRGFLPFADDVVLIDPVTLSPEPLRRAFHVSDSTWRLLPPDAGGDLHSDPELPAGYHSPRRWANAPAPAKWLLVLERGPAGSAPLLPLGPAEAAAAMLSHTSSLKRTTRLALSASARLTERVNCLRLITGDLGRSVEAVEALVGEGS